jgi:hypothetical protein
MDTQKTRAHIVRTAKHSRNFDLVALPGKLFQVRLNQFQCFRVVFGYRHLQKLARFTNGQTGFLDGGNDRFYGTEL